MDPDPPAAKTMLAKIAELPERLLLAVAAAAVIAGLALGAASIWFSATFGSARRRD